MRVAAKYSRTQGHLATELSENYGLAPHPWQANILNDWLAVDENGVLIHSYCILEVPRQNGKTGVSDPRETWGLVARGEKILHTAQEFQTAKKAFDRLRKKFGDRTQCACGSLHRQRRANGSGLGERRSHRV